MPVDPLATSPRVKFSGFEAASLSVLPALSLFDTVIVTTITVFALVTIAQSNVIAITPYWQGGYDGEANGKADNRDAFSYDASCSFNFSDNYCTGYKIGYLIG
jgi:hypothetical protein